MNIRLWIISLLLSFAANVMAQSESLKIENDTTVVSKCEKELLEETDRYERRLERYQQFFNSLTPDFVRVQYAGSVGLFNVGCGWGYGKSNQHETDIMFGYVPKYDKDSPFFTFTLRQTYVPWTEPLYGDVITFQPLSCGVFFNSVLDKDYWTREPDRYPDASYYRFSSKIRIHVFIGQRYTLHIPKHKRYFSSKVSAIWELSTCDLYVVSKAINKTLPLWDTLSLSFGLKFEF